MNQKETIAALAKLCAAPAAAWIGNKLVDGGTKLLQKCTRCGAAQELTLPPGIKDPGDVPHGFDEKLFQWKRAFQVLHEVCVEEAGYS